MSTLDEQFKPQTTLNVGSVNIVQEITEEEKITKLRKMGFKLKPDEYTNAQYTGLVDLLYDFRTTFAQDVMELRGVSDIKYKIELKAGETPKRQRQYKYRPHLRAEIRKQLNDWLDAGIIEKGEAEWTHPIVLVRKKSINDNPTVSGILPTSMVPFVIRLNSFVYIGVNGRR